MPDLFSSPSQNAAAAAGATATASNQEIGQEEQYVNQSEQNLRSAIAGLPPNPYFSGATPPPQVNPTNTTSFGTATPQGGNLFAAPAPQSANLFAAPQQRQTQPVARTAAQ